MNVFRMFADGFHLMAVLVLIVRIVWTGSVHGLSGKSQALYSLVFLTRYVDVLFTYISLYNTSMKVFYILSSFIIIYFIYGKYRQTADRTEDSFRAELLVLLCIALALAFHYEFTIIEVLWTFSIYLEALAILPQLHLISKTGKPETITSHYLFLLGIYRLLYIANWIYRYYTDRYYDRISVIGGAVQTLLYCDFLFLYFTQGAGHRLIFNFGSHRSEIFEALANEKRDKTRTTKYQLLASVLDHKPAQESETLLAGRESASKEEEEKEESSKLEV